MHVLRIANARTVKLTVNTVCGCKRIQLRRNNTPPTDVITVQLHFKRAIGNDETQV